MKIPFRDSKVPNGGHRADKTVPSNLPYLEIYMAIHNCKDFDGRTGLGIARAVGEKNQEPA